MTKLEEMWQKRKAVEMWNGHRYVQVASEDVGKALSRGFLRKEDREKEKNVHTTVYVIHPDHEGLGVHEINALLLPNFLSKGYIRCTESGDPIEKGVVQAFKDAVEKVVKRKSKKSDTPEAETEPGEVSA